MEQKNIRNFSIIAHIDHGKSTLADRLLEITETIDKRHLVNQTLDSMELEREKGITIKLKAVRMVYAIEKEEYQLNLIDTPGHVDFSYEVSRSLVAGEGAILVVDATQGIQAQTIANVYKAVEANLTIIPVINKIDLPNAEVTRTAKEICLTFGFLEKDILEVSAKTGENVKVLLKEIIKKIPHPKGSKEGSSRALVFDSHYDEHLGVIATVKVVDGMFEKNDKIEFFASKEACNIEQLGFYVPQKKETEILKTGEVGYIATGLKDIRSARVGDTIFKQKAKIKSLPGYKEVKPFVFVSIYPIDNDKYPQLREALEKLSLSDSALKYEPESNKALGFGFRCGFLGLLHADIVQERLEREYNLNLISTTPTVQYKIITTKGDENFINTPSEFPNRSSIKTIEEPWIKLNIFTPTKYVGNVISLCEDRRGILVKMEYPSEKTVRFEYELPLSELILNFYDDLKSVSSGFASLDYEFSDYKKVEAVKVDVFVHESIVDPLSMIVLKNKAEKQGREVLKKLKEIIPKQQFKVALQAAIGGKIIARENIPAFRKDVTAKLYGGHRERKDKLLDNQRKNKKRLKKFGKVGIPQEAFRQILKN